MNNAYFKKALSISLMPNAHAVSLSKQCQHHSWNTSNDYSHGTTRMIDFPTRRHGSNLEGSCHWASRLSVKELPRGLLKVIDRLAWVPSHSPSNRGWANGHKCVHQAQKRNEQSRCDVTQFKIMFHKSLPEPSLKPLSAGQPRTRSQRNPHLFLCIAMKTAAGLKFLH